MEPNVEQDLIDVTNALNDLFVSSHDGIYTNYGNKGIRNSYEMWEDTDKNKYVKMKVLKNEAEHFTLFDYDDLEKVKECDGIWYFGHNGYVINSSTKRYLHHLVTDFKGSGRGFQELSIDHINRNTLDNRKANLRLATAEVQQKNSKGRIGDTKRDRQRTAVSLPGRVEQGDLPRYVSYRKEPLKEYFVLECHPAYVDGLIINGNTVLKVFKSIQAQWVDQYAKDKVKYPIADKLKEIKEKCDALDRAYEIYKKTGNRHVTMKDDKVIESMFSKRKAKNTKTVYKYDAGSNELVSECDSIVLTAKDNNVSENTIRRAIKSGKPCQGFYYTTEKR